MCHFSIQNYVESNIFCYKKQRIFSAGRKIQFIKLNISNWRIAKIKCRQIGGLSAFAIILLQSLLKQRSGTCKLTILACQHVPLCPYTCLSNSELFIACFHPRVKSTMKVHLNSYIPTNYALGISESKLWCTYPRLLDRSKALSFCLSKFNQCDYQLDHQLDYQLANHTIQNRKMVIVCQLMIQLIITLIGFGRAKRYSKRQGFSLASGAVEGCCRT